MRITFQQGIITYPIVGSQQSFLKKTGVYVSLSTTNGRTDVAFAHGSSNYIITEASDVSNAWGPIPTSTDVWLYWDIDSQTAIRTFGFTLLQPEYGTTRPSSPSNGQHFFNTSEKKMYVYNSTSGSWRNVIRTFAAKLNNSTFSPLGTGTGSRPYAGTQVGLNNISTLVGRILIDDSGKPIRRSTGTFFTTEDDIFVNGSPVNTIRLEANVLTATAQENMSEYQVAYFSDFGKLNVATYDNLQDSMIVMLMESLTTGATGTVITQGTVTNPAWSFENVGSTLWVDGSGVLVEVDPHISDAITYPQSKPPIGRVISSDTIFFDQGLGGIGPQGLPGPEATVDKATNFVFGTSKLSIAAVDASNPIVVGDNDPRMTDARAPLVHTQPATTITVVPYGSVAATNAQTAIQELADEKVNVAGDTMTGLLTLSGAPTNDLHAATKKYVDDMTLGGLTGVVIDSPEVGEILTYVAPGIWTNEEVNIPSLNDLTDVEIDQPENGEFLSYLDGDWINVASPSGSAPEHELMFGTGSGTDSSPLLTYNKNTGTLSVNDDIETPEHSTLIVGGGEPTQGGNTTIKAGAVYVEDIDFENIGLRTMVEMFSYIEEVDGDIINSAEHRINLGTSLVGDGLSTLTGLPNDSTPFYVNLSFDDDQFVIEFEVIGSEAQTFSELEQVLRDKWDEMYDSGQIPEKYVGYWQVEVWINPTGPHYLRFRRVQYGTTPSNVVIADGKIADGSSPLIASLLGGTAFFEEPIDGVLDTPGSIELWFDDQVTLETPTGWNIPNNLENFALYFSANGQPMKSYPPILDNGGTQEDDPTTIGNLIDQLNVSTNPDITWSLHQDGWYLVGTSVSSDLPVTYSLTTIVYDQSGNIALMGSDDIPRVEVTSYGDVNLGGTDLTQESDTGFVYLPYYNTEYDYYITSGDDENPSPSSSDFATRTAPQGYPIGIGDDVSRIPIVLQYSNNRQSGFYSPFRLWASDPNQEWFQIGAPRIQTITIDVVSPSETIPAGETIDTFIMPYDFKLMRAYASSSVEPEVGGSMISVDIRLPYTSIFADNETLVLDDTVTPMQSIVLGALEDQFDVDVLIDGNIFQGDTVKIVVDNSENSTAKGLRVYLVGYSLEEFGGPPAPQ